MSCLLVVMGLSVFLQQIWFKRYLISWNLDHSCCVQGFCHIVVVKLYKLERCLVVQLFLYVAVDVRTDQEGLFLTGESECVKIGTLRTDFS